MALPLGKLRVRASGSHGGHNGLRNIQEHLGTADYPRMKVGVGAPADEAVDHVLGRFRPSERRAITEAVQKAAEAVLVWVREGTAACMNKYNGEKKVKDASKKRSEDSRKPADNSDAS